MYLFGREHRRDCGFGLSRQGPDWYSGTPWGAHLRTELEKLPIQSIATPEPQRAKVQPITSLAQFIRRAA